MGQYREERRRKPPNDGVEKDFAQALSLHKRHELEPAARLCRRVLQHVPGHADALQLLGAVESEAGNTEVALTLLRRAVGLKPGNGHAHNNLGKALVQAQRLEEALPCFEFACALLPDNLKAQTNRGRTLYKLDRLEEALACFDGVLALMPTDVAALIHRSELLIRLSMADPKWREAAVHALHQALPHSHDADAIRYALASLGAAETPAASPRGYVERVFDGYADEFDHHLTGTLEYRTPQLIGQALQRAGVPAGAQVLDLGCGTGLCAEFLRPLAQHLVGVDLSTKMLDKARERGLYDELVCADIVEHLQGLPSGLDLMVASDVFIYLGDLHPVHASVARVLRPGGLFIYSVESCAEADFLLRPSRRYAHASPYLQRLAQQEGFEVLGLDAVILRKESGAGVAGWVSMLRRPG